MKNILHLKSGIAYIGHNHLVAIEEITSRKEFAGYDLIRVNTQESYAANCVRIDDYVLIPSGYSALQSDLEHLEMSEFQKVDGGLSCLSLQF